MTVLMFSINCKSKTERENMNQEIHNSMQIQSKKYLPQNAFSVPIKGSNNYVHFTEDGKVYFPTYQQRFDITKLHQLHRVCDIKRLIQSVR